MSKILIEDRMNNRIVFDVTNNRTGHVGHIKRRWDNWARQLVY